MQSAGWYHSLTGKELAQATSEQFASGTTMLMALLPPHPFVAFSNPACVQAIASGPTRAARQAQRQGREEVVAEAAGVAEAAEVAEVAVAVVLEILALAQPCL